MTALSHSPSTSQMRRGACPALSVPMMTGDGLLVRIALAAPVSPEAIACICRLAMAHGNGMIDISARGNLQIRGLSERSAARLDDDVRAMNLPLREGLAVEVPPLAGLDPDEIADPRPLADAIRQGARDIHELAPKMTVVVDGAGRMRLSNLLADIRLVAVSKTEWKLLLGGMEDSGHVADVLRETLVVDRVLELLRELAARGNDARGRDLASVSKIEPSLLSQPSQPSSSGLSLGSTITGKEASLQIFATSPSMTRARLGFSPFNLFPLSDDLHAVGIGAAFGQARAEDLVVLCEQAVRLGMSSATPALDHSLVFFGSGAACRALQVAARKIGFIVTAEDARAHIAACSGRTACTSGTITTHAIAAEAATQCHDLLDGSFKLHVSGCAKGCAHPRATALALCGTADGLSLIADGKAADAPFASVEFADTNATLRRLADLVRTQRRAGETSAACLSRLGIDQLAAATGRP